MSDPTKIEVQISFEKGVHENLLVTTLSSNLYRLEETPAFGEANYLDVIEGTANEQGILEVIVIRQPSPLRRYDRLLSKTLIESEQIEAFLDRIIAENGFWERIMGGLLYIYLPHESKLDPDEEIDQIAKLLPNLQ